MTRGQMLQYAIAFALIRGRKITRGVKADLTDEDRFAIAANVVDHLMQYGDPWGLKEEAKPARLHST
jgi:hypothetical protein